MPVVEQATIESVKPSQREKLTHLLYERETMQYRFSYELLMDAFKKLGAGESKAKELLASAVYTRTEDEEKVVKEDLNESIKKILADNKLTGIRSVDPVGRTMDCVTYQTRTASRFNRDVAIEAAPGLGISTKKAIALLDAGIVPGKEITVVAVKEVKGK